MMTQANTHNIYGLVGEGLSHSFSPIIHRVVWDCDYRLFPMTRRELTEFLQRREFCGINVTIPYKQEAFERCDFLDESASRTGAVNTVVNRDGVLYGSNTDLPGFMYCAQAAGISLCGKKVIILGSGGTSHTVRTAAELSGASDIAVISRSGDDNYDNLLRHADAQVLINTTPVGMYPDNYSALVSLDTFPDCEAVMDMIYNPMMTRLLYQAKLRGIRHTNGLPMLAAQGVYSAAAFSGRHFDDSTIEHTIDFLRSDKQNIVLVGMPGCGKTTVGEHLAKMLGKRFVDTDGAVLMKTGMTAEEIIRRDGENAFREIECEIIERVGKDFSTVISAGGGAILKEKNRFALAQNGITVYIRCDTDKLTTQGRPISERVGVAELFKQRREIYESVSDISVDNGGDTQKCVQQIYNLIMDGEMI